MQRGGLILRAAGGFKIRAAGMDGYIVFRFASAFGDDFGGTGATVVANCRRNRMVGTFCGFVHDGHERVGAVGAFVGRHRRRFGFRRRGGFRRPDQRFSAFLRIGQSAEGKGQGAETSDKERFAVDCFHIRFFLCCVSFSGFRPVAIRLRPQEKPAKRLSQEVEGFRSRRSIMARSV